MATDEDSDSTQQSAKPGLDELFSMGEEDPEEGTESPESGNGDGPVSETSESGGPGTEAGETGSGMETPLSPETDDAEILTDDPGGNGQGGSPSSAGDQSTSGAGPTSDSTAGTTDTAGTASATDASSTGANDAEIIAEEPSLPDEPEARRTSQSEAGQPPSAASNRLTTGIRLLDRELEGGIPPGRMLSLVAPPETQSELLVKEMAVSRPTVYISTFRPEWEVREELHDHQQKSNDEGVLENELQVSYVDPEHLLASPKEYIGDLPNGSNLIIDSINEFELEDRKRYVEFLNTVKEVLWDTGSVGLFYGIEEATDPPARSLTLKRSDIVWQLDHDVAAHEIETSLIISKFRGGKALTEPVKLVLTDSVQVDMSRDIG